MKRDKRSPAQFALKEWEEWLAPQVRQVELLGEIPITANECAQLGQVIGLRVRTLEHRRGLKTLLKDYPCALAVYLVAQGVYGYQGGDYWSEVVQVTKFKRNYAWQVGQALEEILINLGLPLFPDMRAEAHRYVSLILAHGGIPNYCLPDFFKNMLQPSVLRAQYADLPAAELIDEWAHRSSVQYFTDKPVLRFLTYGGQVAQDFVERCREMAWDYLDSGIVPDAETVGLPRRVVAAYGQWVAEQDVDQIRRSSTERWRLRKPQVLIDPWGEGVLLDLPPQQVPATMIQADIRWQVAADEESNPPIPVRVRRTGFDLKTVAELAVLDQPAEVYDVSLLVDGEVKRTWHYRGINDERPLLIFDPDRSTLLSWQHSLPARRLGLLYPDRFELQIEGDDRLLEELPRLPWGWAGFCGQIWDLSQATRLHLLRQGEPVLSVTLRPDETVQRPYLHGGTLLSTEIPGVRAPVYVGSPPAVRIPLTSRRGLAEELTRWRLTVRNKWAAMPEIDSRTPLTELRLELTPGEGYVELPLSLPTLLGQTPRGNYLVRLRGPLGRDAEFTLRIVPQFVIHGHQSLYLPDPTSGPQPARFTVETAPGDELAYQGEGDQCHIQLVEQLEDSWKYEVEASPEVTNVELVAVRPRPDDDAVRVPVPVPVRRLRWALVGEQTAAGHRQWTGQIIKRPVDALLQAQSPYLLVELPLPDDSDDPVGLTLRLLNIDNDELQVEYIDPHPGQRFSRFDLSAFLDTVRASLSPVMRFELMIWDLPGHDEPLRLPVLSLTRTLVVNDVKLMHHHQDGHLIIKLKWKEPVKLRNRQVRLWPLWRPWEPVFERPIPDETKGAMFIETPPGELSLGKYRLEFLVVDPWVSPGAPSRPSPGAPSTADVELISAEQRLQTLAAQLQQEGPQFKHLLERIAILQDTGDPQQAQADWQWCYEHLDEGTIPQIVALAELTQATDEQATLRSLQLKMFAARRVEHLMSARRQGEISPDRFWAYLSHLPGSGRLLPKTTCELLLTIEDEAIRLHAVQQLLRRGDALGVETVLGWVASARLSDDDAIGLFALNPNSAMEHLREQSEQPNVARLIDALSREVQDVIKVGQWIHSNLGWGRIERIEKLDTGDPVNWCAGRKSRFQLVVVLHPHIEPETIIIDLPSFSADFSARGKIFICAECHAFSTCDMDLMIKHFKIVHPPKTKKEAKERGNVYARVEQKEEEDRPILLAFLEIASQAPPPNSMC